MDTVWVVRGPDVRAHGEYCKKRVILRGHGSSGRLAGSSSLRHHGCVDDSEATQLILETLFDVRGAVYEIHGAILGEDDDEEEAQEDA